MLRERAVLNESGFAGLIHTSGEPAALAVLLDESGEAGRLAGAELVEPDIVPRATGNAPDPLWWTVLASFMDGFGAYSLAPHVVADAQDASAGAFGERLPHDV